VGTTGVSGKVVGRIEESERIGGGDVVKGGAVGNRGRVMCTHDTQDTPVQPGIGSMSAHTVERQRTDHEGTVTLHLYPEIISGGSTHVYTYTHSPVAHTYHPPALLPLPPPKESCAGGAGCVDAHSNGRESAKRGCAFELASKPESSNDGASGNAALEQMKQAMLKQHLLKQDLPSQTQPDHANMLQQHTQMMQQHRTANSVTQMHPLQVVSHKVLPTVPTQAQLNVVRRTLVLGGGGCRSERTHSGGSYEA